MWIKSGMAKSPCHVIQKVARAVPPLRNGAAGASVRAPKGAHKKSAPKAKASQASGPSTRPGCARFFASARPGCLCLFFLCVARRCACFCLCAFGCARRAPPPAQLNEPPHKAAAISSAAAGSKGGAVPPPPRDAELWVCLEKKLK